MLKPAFWKLGRSLKLGLGLALLVGLAGAGEWASHRLPLGLPGAILGLLAYLALLAASPRIHAWTGEAAERLLKVLGILITPAAVGLATHTDAMASELGRIVIVLVVSTLATGLATWATFRLVTSWRR
ncbi:CidA/LrgA family protein [Parapedomonas caeni]|jgi:holin-like protein